MITAKAFAGKHYAVYGLARSGLATVEALLASGAKVTAWDGNPETREKLSSSLSRSDGEVAPRSGDGGAFSRSGMAPPPLPSAAVPLPTGFAGREELEIADLDTADLTQFDSLIVSPGVPLNRHPIAQRAREANLQIIGDIELFARARAELPPHKVVGITGTNGKSTTTALVHHILKTAGVPTTMGGNIGLPILSQDPLPEGGVYVLELSSYQIDLTKSLDCDVAVLLNITPDHLDRYESFEAYAASKARLFEMQSSDMVALLNDNDPEAYKILVRLWNTERHMAGKISAFDDYDLGVPGWPQCEWAALQGPHNSENALAAVAVTHELGVSEFQLAALKTFAGLPHRMERILECDGVLFVNDSKATNPEAAAPALAAYPRIRWIVGGQAKTESLGDTERHLDHVAHAYTIGEAGPMFARLLRERGVAVTECETLENAVNHAARDSHSGDVVLLSPACASFDQFRDFEQRGDRFRELVGAL